MRSLPAVLALVLVGCNNDASVIPCMGDIEVGIYAPVDNERFAEGMDVSLTARVTDRCGYDLQTSFWTLSSDLQEQVVIDWEIIEDEIIVTPLEPLMVGTHLLTLNATGENGQDGSDTLSITIVENEPPTVSFMTPGDEGATFDTTEPVMIHAVVADSQEPLDSLQLAWTVDGAPYDGPEYADELGNATFELTGVASGCHDIAVTVTDMKEQSDSDAGSFISYASEEELNAYQWWVDEDGDGWGSDIETVLACEQPSNTVAVRSDGLIDCDDTDAEIYPTRPDYCDDGIDSDCSPFTPKGCFPLGDIRGDTQDFSITWRHGATSVGRRSAAMRNIGDLNGDGHDDLMMGSRIVRVAGSSVKMVAQGAGLYGPLNSNVTMSDSTYADYYATAGYVINNSSQHFGSAISEPGDVTDDGRTDFVVGVPVSVVSPGSGIAGDWYGSVYLINGYDEGYEPDLGADLAYASLSSAYQPDNEDGYTVYGWYGPSKNSDFGREVAYTADITGDGRAEILMSAPSAGEVFLVRSDDMEDMPYGSQISDTYHWRLESDDRIGQAMASTDVDGDGYGDLLISAGTSEGGVYVVFGREMPSYQSNQNIAAVSGIRWEGGGSGDEAGADIVALWDLDEDGDNEYAVSAPGAADGDGVVYIVPGFYDATGTYALDEEVPGVSTLNARQPVPITGSGGLEALGTGGDANGDGYDDLLIGAPGSTRGATEGGAVYVLYFGPDGFTSWWDTDGYPRAELNLDDEVVKDTAPVARVYGTTNNERLGLDIAFIGDIDESIGDDFITSSIGEGQWHAKVFLGGAY